MSIQLKVPVFVKGLCFKGMFVSCSLLFAADYKNFDLPSAKPAELAAISYTSSRVSLKGSGVRFKDPGVNATSYVTEKEVFVAEKRDEAIKILRTQLDAGLAANRDNLLLRLGQLYAEKYMELSYRENEVFSQVLKLGETRQAEGSRPNEAAVVAPRLDNSRSQRYLKDALTVFNTLEKEYPNHPKIDEVDFFIGFVELEQGGERRGVRYLERVVQRYSKSRKFDEALVHLGDYYFEKHKLSEAIARFRALSQRRESPLYHYALYKLAWCDLNQGRARDGLNNLKKLVGELAGVQEPAKFNLRNQTLKDMVVFFVEVEAVDEAISFYRGAVGTEVAAENIKLIADMLRAKARDESAVRAYLRVLEFFGDSLEAPRAEMAIFESSLRLGRIEKGVERYSKAVARYAPESKWAKKYSEQPAGLLAVHTELAAQTEKAALYFHQSAQKSSNKTSYRYALLLYDAILKHFPSQSSLKKIAFYRAEILFNQSKWLEASDGYMQVAKIEPKDKLSDESVYNALLALDRLTAKAENLSRYSKEQQKTLDMTQEPIPVHEQRFLEIGEYYLSEYPQGERVVDVRFRMAAIYYRHNYFAPALEIFQKVAVLSPKHRSATTAAHLVLDIYNIQKNYPKLNEVAAQFASIKDLGDAEFKREVEQILAQITFKGIEGYEKQSLWAEAAQAYWEFYSKNPKTDLGGDALYNALIAYERLNDSDKITELSRLFLKKFPDHQYSKRVMLVSAKLAERTYDVETALNVYEEFYRKYPQDPEAHKALFNAAVFSELIEKNSKALELYGRYLKDEKVSVEESRSIRLSLAKIHRRMGSWEKVNRIYRELSKEATSPEDRLAFLGELARSYEKGGKLGEKEALLKEMTKEYENNKRMRTGPGVQYVAEAKFRELQKIREKFEMVKLRFPPEDLIYLLRKKQRLLGQLVKGYDKVVEIGVPEWGVAALYEKSRCFANFVETYRAVKVPDRYKDAEKAEAAKAIADIDSQLVKPIESKTEEALKVCVSRASQFHVAGEYAEKCRSLVAGEAFRPLGVVPRPSYWSTRWPQEEGVARR